MTDLVRRALLGDTQAQKECTAQGIALPCPFCGQKPSWVTTGENNDLLRFGCLQDMQHCIVWTIPFTKPYHENALQMAVNRWNTRAPVPTAEQIERLEANDVPERSD